MYVPVDNGGKWDIECLLCETFASDMLATSFVASMNTLVRVQEHLMTAHDYTDQDFMDSERLFLDEDVYQWRSPRGEVYMKAYRRT